MPKARTRWRSGTPLIPLKKGIHRTCYRNSVANLSLFIILQVQTLLLSSCSSSGTQSSVSRPELEILFASPLVYCLDSCDNTDPDDDFCFFIRNATQYTLELDRMKLVYADNLTLTFTRDVAKESGQNDQDQHSFVMQKAGQDANKKSLAFLSGQKELKAGQIKAVHLKIGAGERIASATTTIRVLKNGKELDVKLFSLRRHSLAKHIKDLRQSITRLESDLGVLSTNAAVNCQVINGKGNDQEAGSELDNCGQQDAYRPNICTSNPEDLVDLNLDYTDV